MRRLRVKFRGYSVTGESAAFAHTGGDASLLLVLPSIDGSVTLAQTNMDATTWAAYSAALTAGERAAIVVAALTGTVVVEVVDGVGAVRASGTMIAPWASSTSGGAITAGEVTVSGVLVSAGGSPDANWWCRFRSGTRFVRAPFSLVGGGGAYTWSFGTFATGARGTLGTVTMTATVTSQSNRAPAWGSVPTITIQRGQSISLLAYASDPDGNPMTFAVAAASPTTQAALSALGLTLSSAGVLTAAADATLGQTGNVIVAADDSVSTGSSITTLQVTSAVGGAALPFTFGQPFKQGDVPSGETVTGDVTDFQSVPMTYWPDGSLKHAIISGRAALTAGVPRSIVLTLGAGTSGAALSITDLKASIAASTSVTVGGTTMALSGTFLDSPQRTVCTGAVMSNWIYRLAVSGSSHLVIWADVRLYKGGAVEIFPWVENAYLNVASPASTTSTACSVTIGGASRFSQSISIAHHTRIPLLTGSTFSYWSGTDPQITPAHNTSYLRATKLVPNYGAVTPAAATLNALQQTYTPNTIAGVSANMGSAGGSGAVVGWYGLPAQPFYCITGDVRAYRAAIAFGLSGGSWSTHYRDSATNEFIRYDQHASTGLDTVASGSGTTNGTFAVTHQPSFGYLPWLITGRWWFLDETLSAATYNYLAQAALRRRGETAFATAPYYAASGSAGIIDPRTGSYTVRGAAWSLNSLFLTAAILPSSHPCYESIKATVEWNTAFYKATFVDGTHASGHVNQLGILGTYSSGGTSLYGTGHSATSNYWYDAGWQHAMMVQVWGFARALSLPQTTTSQTAMEAVAQHGLRLPAGLAGDGGTGSWNWRRFIVYHFPIGQDENGLPVDTPAATFGEALAEYERELGTLATTAGLPLKLHSSNSDYTGTGTSSFTYGGQMIAALALAADAGAPGATAGWARITASSTWAVMQSEFATDPSYYFAPRA